MKAQDEVYKIIKKFLYNYYNEFTPEMYERTYQLLSSLVESRIISKGNGYEAEIYFNFDGLNYVTVSGKEVMDAAAKGEHGVERVAYRGTGIWNEPKEILDAQAKDILKDMLISEGIPIK